jgi:thiamine-phosphate pyrophosphorylase
MTTSPFSAMAQAIVDIHGPALGLQRPEGRNAEPATPPHNLQSAVDQACLQMGFDAIDAQTVAAAWAVQSARLGGFDAQQWPVHASDFGQAPWPREAAFAPCPRQLGLYVVAPDAPWVARLARAGVPTVQLRFKSADACDIAAEVAAAVKAVQGTSSLLFINDHWRQAIAAGAYGVHLGQEDLDGLGNADLATIRQSGLRLGVSTHGYAEMLRADKVSPSYIAMGAVFPTTLKRMQTLPQGPGRLAAYARLMQHYPLVAIGGIDLERLDAVLASGVGSVAVVRAVIAASDPEAEIKRWMHRIAQHQNG